jgi:phenylpyruvate tautomerase PptA (4-oxalocrotonate tautomerase family)
MNTINKTNEKQDVMKQDQIAKHAKTPKRNLVVYISVMDPKNWTPPKGRSKIIRKESRWANHIEPTRQNLKYGWLWN